MLFPDHFQFDHCLLSSVLYPVKRERSDNVRNGVFALNRTLQMQYPICPNRAHHLIGWHISHAFHQYQIARKYYVRRQANRCNG